MPRFSSGGSCCADAESLASAATYLHAFCESLENLPGIPPRVRCGVCRIPRQTYVGVTSFHSSFLCLWNRIECSLRDGFVMSCQVDEGQIKLS